jgi:hypothetical protein
LVRISSTAQRRSALYSRDVMYVLIRNLMAKQDLRDLGFREAPRSDALPDSTAATNGSSTPPGAGVKASESKTQRGFVAGIR